VKNNPLKAPPPWVVPEFFSPLPLSLPGSTLRLKSVILKPRLLSGSPRAMERNTAGPLFTKAAGSSCRVFPEWMKKGDSGWIWIKQCISRQPDSPFIHPTRKNPPNCKAHSFVVRRTLAQVGMSSHDPRSGALSPCHPCVSSSLILLRRNSVRKTRDTKKLKVGCVQTRRQHVFFLLLFCIFVSVCVSAFMHERTIQKVCVILFAAAENTRGKPRQRERQTEPLHKSNHKK